MERGDQSYGGGYGGYGGSNRDRNGPYRGGSYDQGGGRNQGQYSYRGGEQYSAGYGDSGGYGGGGGGGYSYGGNRDRQGGGHQQRGDNDLGQSLNTINWSDHQLVAYEKCFYNEHKEVADLSQEAVARIRGEFEITIKSGSNVPNPVSRFEHAGFPDSILSNIKRAGFEKPSAIQVQTWPIALSGRDMIGIAQTGSGKTLAFLLPAIVHIKAQPKIQTGEGPVCLVMAPTRELTEQIKRETDKFTEGMNIKNTACYGGVPRRSQAFDLRNGVEICIATPGRLIDFLSSNTLNLHRVTFLVLDEADRMLDMGFEPQIKSVVSQVRAEHQTLMLSATWPPTVQKFAMNLFTQSEPIHIVIGSDGLSANKDIRQVIMMAEHYDKERLCEKVLADMPGRKVLVFTDTKRRCDQVCSQLRSRGIRALAIHGDKKQEERNWVLAEFKSGGHPVLVATDVASRGLDVRDVEAVVNLDMPSDIESYVHRIGRTGRAGAKGTAYTFFSSDNGRQAKELVQILRGAEQEVPPELIEMSKQRYGPASGRGGRGGRFGGGGRR